ncbi:23S rRNA pseudouridine(2604) synthase RluF [Flavobacterium sp. J49]|uniref:23S rRNA pseudouridine(2604) synthase RluF n=1 Tax=Flavobacterium sp. J49 TaxID=2718534 RepID=UPI0015947F7D|nr:23S rRNA pseudouridine(2604) synthase RluF [Flavobacterium sp. J49]MBF6639884.1 23S rRNA pseudouridine(2604) synthase RluF [Flavobacterium sp. J49]NIC01129.1 23S rRNA pseudouridine(2604) synthase RluF [Flavobacterium sp. J49]
MEVNQTRINKFLSESGFCSRREADKLLEQGRITINGKVPELGTKVSAEDEIRVDGKLIREKTEKPIYLAFYKPVGIECTTNQNVRDNIVDYINYPKRIFPIGRLDKASEGLIFMTNDGDIVNKILRARNNHEKEYIVTVNRPITDRFIERMGNGIPILDTVTRKCKVEQISKYIFKIILTQGLNRQIRRMCEYLGYEVTALKRTRIINISLDVHVGRYRELTDTEIKQLNELIEPSSKTEEASLPKTTQAGNRKPEEGRKNSTIRIRKNPNSK